MSAEQDTITTFVIPSAPPAYPPRYRTGPSFVLSPEVMDRLVLAVLVGMLVTSLLLHLIRRGNAADRYKKLVEERDERFAPLLHRVHVGPAMGSHVPFAVLKSGRYMPAPGVEIQLEDGRVATLDPAVTIASFGDVPLRRGDAVRSVEVDALAPFWLLAEEAVDAGAPDEAVAQGSPFRDAVSLPTLNPVGAAYRLATSREELLDPVELPETPYRGWMGAVGVAAALFGITRLFDPALASGLVLTAVLILVLVEPMRFLAVINSESRRKD
jgi:hypothetical protein